MCVCERKGLIWRESVCERERLGERLQRESVCASMGECACVCKHACRERGGMKGIYGVINSVIVHIL